MRLVSLYFENFMAHKKQLFTFTKEGPYVILGQNLDDNGKSNGCGKSSIFAGISLALYNQTRSKTLSQAITAGEKYMKVVLVLQKKDKYYRITRNRRKDGTSSTTLETASDEAFTTDLDDITGHNQDETQARIVNLMRMDYHGFCNSLYFKEKAADIFADSTRGARFEIIKNSLGVDLYDKIGKEAKKDLDTLNEEMNKSSAIIDAAALNTSQIEKYEDELEIDNTTLKILQQELEGVEREIADLHHKKGSLGQIEANLKQLKIDLDSVRRSHGGLVNKRQGLINTKQDYDKRLQSARLELSGLKTEMDELKAIKAATPPVSDDEIEAITSRISLMNNTRANLLADQADAAEALKTMQSKRQHSTSCPTCRQELSKSARESVIKMCQETMESAKKQVESLTSDIQKATAEKQSLITHKNTLADVTNRIASITERASSVKRVGEHYKEAVKQAELECAAVDGDISELLERKLGLENSIAELERTISSVVKSDESSLISKKNYTSTKITEINRAIGIKTQTIEQLKSSIPDDVEDIKNKIKDLWVKREVISNVLDSCSKKGGIPSVLIAQAITEIELYTNQMLSGFTFECANMHVKLMMSKPDEIDIQVRKANEAEFRDFDSFSGGERFIVSFAIRMALSNILSNKYGADVRFILLDEAGMQLDEYNNGLFAAMIKRLAKDRLILLITHQNILKEHISQTILIRRSNGKSEVFYS